MRKNPTTELGIEPGTPWLIASDSDHYTKRLNMFKWHKLLDVIIENIEVKMNDVSLRIILLPIKQYFKLFVE